MKTGRLLAYAAVGIIAGLLLENTVLQLKQKTGAKARKLKKTTGRKITHLRRHHMN
jgi:sulfite exporter TauE/SafE